MKKRNFLLSLLASLFGAKAIAADTQSVEIPPSRAVRLSAGREIPRDGASPGDSREHFELSIRVNRRDPRLHDLIIRRFSREFYVNGRPKMERLVTLAVFTSANRDAARLARAERYLESRLVRYPKTTPPDPQTRRVIFGCLARLTPAAA